MLYTSLEDIFYPVDEFCKIFSKFFIEPIDQNKRGPKNKTFDEETMTILLFYHFSKMKTFKDYYELWIRGKEKTAFRHLVSYNRFLELIPGMLPHMILFFYAACRGSAAEANFIDSTPLTVCLLQRRYSHKVFKEYAALGKTSVGWFYGFKLHLVINQFGQIINFHVTPGNVSDIDQNVLDIITKRVIGLLFGDRGYISKNVAKILQSRGIILITRKRKNMKKVELNEKHQYLLAHRGIVETTIGKLKNMDLEHTRHRSILGWFANIISCICAYAFDRKKPYAVFQPERLLAILTSPLAIN
jgi:hypothetical protein